MLDNISKKVLAYMKDLENCTFLPRRGFPKWISE